MTEEEYITATNLAKVRTVVTILNDVMRGNEYGVNRDDYNTAFTCLSNIQDILYKKVKIKESDCE